MAFAPPFQRTFSATFDRRAAAAAAPWWLSGGVAAANAVAVYQPKGAASLAASYTNLANPGTYDAAPGVAPTFDAATGWTFNGSTQYLKTGLVPVLDQTWTLIVAFTDATTGGGTVAGAWSDPGGWIMLQPYRADTFTGYLHGIRSRNTTGLAAGVMAVAGVSCYRNGSLDSTMSAGAGANTNSAQLVIGASSYNGGVTSYRSGKIQAVSIYDTTLSATQVGLISTAMAAL